MERQKRMSFPVAQALMLSLNTSVASRWAPLQVRAWTPSTYVHACLTHPVVFVFASVIRVWLTGRDLCAKSHSRNHNNFNDNAHSNGGDVRYEMG